MQKIKHGVRQIINAVAFISGSFAASLAVILHLGTEQSFRDSLPVNHNLASLGFFVLIMFAAYHAFRSWDDVRGKCIVLILSVLFGLSQVLGNCLHMADSLDPLFADSEQWTKTLIAFTGYAYLFAVLCTLLFRRIAEHKIYTTTVPALRFPPPGKMFFITIWVLIFIAYIPYFLALFPGVLSPDSCQHLEQALGMSPYTDHTPVVYTLLIKVFIKGTGGDIYTVVTVFSLAQMLFVSGMFAYALYKMSCWDFDNRLIFAAGLFFAFFPINAVYSITMWKDVLFSGAILLMTLVCIDLVRLKGEFFHGWRNRILLIVVFLAVMFLRHNGIYIALITFLALIITIKPLRAKLIMAVSLVICLTIFGGFKSYISTVLKAEPVPVREMLSVPLQQFARVAKEHGNQLSEKEKNFLSQLNSVDNIEVLAQRYLPRISDPVKELLNKPYYYEHFGEFIRMWISLGVQYPGTYVAAFFNNNFGYWTVTESGWAYWISFAFAGHNDYCFELKRRSLFPAFEEFILKYHLANDNSMPVYSQFYSLGLAFWLFMLCAATLIWCKRYEGLLALLPLFILWLTCCTSPVHGEYRYMYGMICTLPVVIGYALPNFSNKK